MLSGTSKRNKAETRNGDSCERRALKPRCSIDSCDNPAKAQGLCRAHYNQAYRRKSIPIKREPKDKAGADFLALAIEVGKERRERVAECLIWPFHRQNRGYAVLHGQGEADLVSRIVCEAVHGPAPEGKPLALHNCDNGAGGCIEPTHIEWGSYRQNNVEDRKRAGTFDPFGRAKHARAI